ncbi:FAD-dependent oxidoreductase [Erysipelothrix aquatica]|uniref:FAD-dependent oxidoreductase n=1 Tax=Erysipelothrix aquatica TaxID=2683714 RepID=UPI001359A25A|nr:FAD-dependent oxidoreductase [Erysipelothrix aquatica]
MKEFKNIFIGFGKGAKTLAKELSKHGESSLVIEKSVEMYGGTCINIGCIPSKSLILSASEGKPQNLAVSIKDETTQLLRKRNYHMLSDDKNITVLDGTARFLSDKIVEVTDALGNRVKITGDRIFINTGSVPVEPKLSNLIQSEHYLDSTKAMELLVTPKTIVVIGAGYIGLEYASMFNDFGSKVTIIDERNEFMPNEDHDVAEAVLQSLTKKGIEIRLGVKLKEAEETDGILKLTISTCDGRNETIYSEKVLGAIGRKPNTEHLNLEKTTIEVNERGAIVVDKYLRTTAKGVWALGDVKGGLQFTYISLDDYRIVLDSLYGDARRTTENRGNVPYTLFITPPLSHVGKTEKILTNEGKTFDVYKLDVSRIPKSHVIGDKEGLFKVIVDPQSRNILGATLFGNESHEMINLLSLAIDLKVDYHTLKNRIYTHPTMTESLNDLF